MDFLTIFCYFILFWRERRLGEILISMSPVFIRIGKKLFSTPLAGLVFLCCFVCWFEEGDGVVEGGGGL